MATNLPNLYILYIKFYSSAFRNQVSAVVVQPQCWIVLWSTDHFQGLDYTCNNEADADNAKTCDLTGTNVDDEVESYMCFCPCRKSLV